MRLRALRRPVFAAGLVLTLAAMAACGSDDGGSTSNTSQGPKGEPIHLGLIANSTSFEALSQGAQIAIDAVNAKGGVQGRPLKLVACDNKINTNAAAGCARQFAADKQMIATVGSISTFGGDTNPVLEAAGLAGIGTAPLGAGDFSSPVVFPVTPGGQVIVAGAILLQDTLKDERKGVITMDTPTATALPGLIDSAIYGPRGTKLAVRASVPVSAADLGPQSAALAGTDGVVVALTTQLQYRYIQTARQQGYDGDIVISGTEADPGVIAKQLAGADSNLYIMSQFDRTSAGFTAMQADIKTYDASAPANDTVASGYLSVKIFAEVAAGLPSLSRSTVLDAMKGLHGFDTDGLTLPLDYTVPGRALGGQAPRLFPAITVAYPYKYADHKFVPVGDGEPIDIYNQGS